MKVDYGDEHHSTRSVHAKPPTGELTVPVIRLEGAESVALGFRDHLFDLVDDDGTKLGSMTCTSFSGGDALIMKFGEHSAFVRGRDLFAAWVRQVDPEGAKMLPESVRYAS